MNETLREIVAEMRSYAEFGDQTGQVTVSEWAGRLESLSASEAATGGEALDRDAIVVNLMRHCGLDKHKARGCANIVLMMLAIAPPPPREADRLERLSASESTGGEVERLAAMVAATYSHVDGRDLLHELKPNSAHHIDIVVRINGQDKHYQGDWLKALTWARDGHNKAEHATPPLAPVAATGGHVSFKDFLDVVDEVDALTPDARRWRHLRDNAIGKWTIVDVRDGNILEGDWDKQLDADIGAASSPRRAAAGRETKPMKLLGYANPSRIRMTCASKPGGAHLGQVAIYAGESVDPMEIQEQENPTHMGEPDFRPACYSCGCRSDNPRDWMGRSICSKCRALAGGE